jgi:ribosomal protein L1
LPKDIAGARITASTAIGKPIAIDGISVQSDERVVRINSDQEFYLDVKSSTIRERPEALENIQLLVSMLGPRGETNNIIVKPTGNVETIVEDGHESHVIRFRGTFVAPTTPGHAMIQVRVAAKQKEPALTWGFGVIQ